MKKTKTTITEFGKIVEEIAASKYDCCMTHIYIFKKPVEEVENYLLSLVRTVPADKIHNYMIHWNNNTEDILGYFGEEYFVY